MPAHLGQLPYARAGLRCRGEEPAAQAVAAVGAVIKADPPCVALHDPRRAVVRQGLARHPSAPPHCSEHRAVADRGRCQPRLHRLNRAQLVASGNRHLLPLPFLVTLRAPDQDPQPVWDLGQIGDLERAEFGATERPGKAQA